MPLHCCAQYPALNDKSSIVPYLRKDCLQDDTSIANVQRWSLHTQAGWAQMADHQYVR